MPLSPPPGFSCQPLAYSLEELETLTSVSRSQLYVEIQAGRLVASNVGRRRIVTHENAVAWLSALPTSSAAGEAA